MNRHDVESWLEHHPTLVHANPKALLNRCEREVRSHTHRDAWKHAREVTEESLHRFERVFGLPASDVFVTREVCHEIAREMRHQEPHLEATSEAELVSRSVLDALDPQAREKLREWLMELAEKEEHAVWLEIVRFTDHMARSLIRDAGMTRALEWDFDHSYPRVAARVAKLMMQEFEAHSVAEDDDDWIGPSAH